MPRVQVSRRSGSTYVPPEHLIRLRDGGDDHGDGDDDHGSEDEDDEDDEDGSDDEDKGKKNKKNGKGRGKDGKKEGQTAPPQPSPPAPGIASIPPPSQGIPAPGASQGASQGLPVPKEAYVPPSPSLVSAAAATPAGGGEAAQTSTGDSAPPSTTTSSSESGESATPSAVGSPAGVAANAEPSPTPSSSNDPASSATSTDSVSTTAASTVDASSSPPSGSGAAPTDSASNAVGTCSTATSSRGRYVKRDRGGGSKNKWEKSEYDEDPCGNSVSNQSPTPFAGGQSSQSPQAGLPVATPPPSKQNLVIVGVASALVSFTVVSAIIWGLWFLVRRRRKQRRAYEAAQDAARFAIVDPAALPASMYAGRSSPSAVYLAEGRTTPGAGLNVIYGRVTPNSFESVSVPQFITAQEADALHAREAAANPNPFMSSDDRDSAYGDPFAHPHDRKFTSDSHDAESMYTMSV